MENQHSRSNPQKRTSFHEGEEQKKREDRAVKACCEGKRRSTSLPLQEGRDLAYLTPDEGALLGKGKSCCSGGKKSGEPLLFGEKRRMAFYYQGEKGRCTLLREEETKKGRSLPKKKGTSSGREENTLQASQQRDAVCEERDSGSGC